MSEDVVRVFECCRLDAEVDDEIDLDERAPRLCLAADQRW